VSLHRQMGLTKEQAIRSLMSEFGMTRKEAKIFLIDMGEISDDQ